VSHFDLIIFDCDGVLVDSEIPTNTVLRDMVNELGGNITLADSMNQFMGHSVADAYSQALIEKMTGGKPPADFYEQFLIRRDNALREHVTPIPHIADVLPALRLPYAVASGAETAKMHLTLGKTGLMQFFKPERLFGKDLVKHSKPAPDVYLLAAKMCGADPKRCVVVEDTASGTTAGVAAGMTVLGYCAMTPPEKLLAAGASAVFNDMRRLPMLVRG
jgi:HAD superfamily hydrolase (TIGR01509 family)